MKKYKYVPFANIVCYTIPVGSIVITNNPLVREKFQQNRRHTIEFLDTDYAGVLKAVRDKVHRGYALETHPLSGSVKPGETPYKTVIITGTAGGLDKKSLGIIEESILTCEKLKSSAGNIKWSEKMLADFQLIDYNLISDKEIGK